MRNILLVAAIGVGILGCNTTQVQHKAPLTVAPYSLATLNVKGRVISSDFFRLDGAESFIYLTDSFLPIDDTNRKKCVSLEQCQTFHSLVQTSRYWYMTPRITAAGDHPKIIHGDGNTVSLVFSDEAFAASRKAEKKKNIPQWSKWEANTVYYVEFNHPLFAYDARRTAAIMGSKNQQTQRR